MSKRRYPKKRVKKNHQSKTDNNTNNVPKNEDSPVNPQNDSIKKSPPESKINGSEIQQITKIPSGHLKNRVIAKLKQALNDGQAKTPLDQQDTPLIDPQARQPPLYYNGNSTVIFEQIEVVKANAQKNQDELNAVLQKRIKTENCLGAEENQPKIEDAARLTSQPLVIPQEQKKSELIATSTDEQSKKKKKKKKKNKKKKNKQNAMSITEDLETNTLNQQLEKIKEVDNQIPEKNSLEDKTALNEKPLESKEEPNLVEGKTEGQIGDQPNHDSAEKEKEEPTDVNREITDNLISTIIGQEESHIQLDQESDNEKRDLVANNHTDANETNIDQATLLDSETPIQESTLDPINEPENDKLLNGRHSPEEVGDQNPNDPVNEVDPMERCADNLVSEVFTSEKFNPVPNSDAQNDSNQKIVPQELLASINELLSCLK